MCDSTSNASSLQVYGKFHPEDVEKWIKHLAKIKLFYSKLNILLSVLREIAESERCLSSETVLKIKNAVLFGDIGEYVEFPTRRLFDEPKRLTLLGIPKEYLVAQNLALNENERTTIMELVEKKLQEKLTSVAKIFKLESGECKVMETDRIKQVPILLENFVNAHRSTDLMFTFYNRYLDKMKSCQYEIIRMNEINRFLVEERVNNFTSCFLQSLKVVERHEDLMRQATRYYGANIRKEIFSQDTIEALKVIKKRQEDEIEEKEDKIETLKKQVAEYEALYSEGFESVLKEYLEVEKALESARFTLKALEPQKDNDNNNV